MKHISLLLLFGITLIACNQEKKAEQAEVQEVDINKAHLVRAKYTIGDSIRVGFSERVENLKVQLDGKEMSIFLNGADTLSVATNGQKPGWHQLVIVGNAADKKIFNDTLRIEFLSDSIPVEIKYNVAASFPHQKSSFTEGLEFYKGDLYEGTGQNGSSKLLKIDLKTGSTLKEISLDQKYFGEGITIVNDKIYQLTWQSGICFRYNMDFTLDKTFTYYFQGWGLTHRDTTLIMSDGSNKIHFYNTMYEKIGDLEVYDQNGPVRNINELEYLNGFIYANIFETTKIIKIDAVTGKVVGFMDMKGMVPSEIDARKDVLNGIAYSSADQSLYVTGKNWPTIFRIKINNSRIL